MDTHSVQNFRNVWILIDEQAGYDSEKSREDHDTVENLRPKATSDIKFQNTSYLLSALGTWKINSLSSSSSSKKLLLYHSIQV
mmetsp:Transcript_11007/g.26207  ORF Transcript_11007/g.26207 Transcript_11007/m.26207 type:complete len:83 (+) Transcript_11007:1309-1557(+)